MKWLFIWHTLNKILTNNRKTVLFAAFNLSILCLSVFRVQWLEYLNVSKNISWFLIKCVTSFPKRCSTDTFQPIYSKMIYAHLLVGFAHPQHLLRKPLALKNHCISVNKMFSLPWFKDPLFDPVPRPAADGFWTHFSPVFHFYTRWKLWCLKKALRRPLRWSIKRWSETVIWTMTYILRSVFIFILIFMY